MTAVELWNATARPPPTTTASTGRSMRPPQPEAQHLAIGPLDPGPHHAGRIEHQCDRAAEVQEHHRAAHGRPPGGAAAAGAGRGVRCHKTVALSDVPPKSDI